MAKRTIPARWADFDGLKGEKSSPVFAFSEYIDNSISSYLGNHDSIEGLRIQINIKTDGEDKQWFEVVDNAGGMSEEELYEAIIPNNKKNKTITKLNQFGIGMKLATFWFGRTLKIITKNKQSKHQFELNIEITDNNLNDSAEVDIIKNKTYQFTERSGTYIKVGEIRTKPSRILRRPSIEELIKALGWRYGELLNKGMLILINFKTDNNKEFNYKISNFAVSPYKLSDTIDAYKSKNKTKFDEYKYKEYLDKEIKKWYERDEERIKSITNNVNFYNYWKEDKKLEFTCHREIEGKKNVKVIWGIIAIKETENNDPYSYEELTGFTLLNYGRAIFHGPNTTDFEKQDVVNFRTFPFYEKGKSTQAGFHVHRRLYGVIDLSDVEEADRNKSVFNWGVSGQHDIAKIASEIFTIMRPILQIMFVELEKKPEIIRKEAVNKGSSQQKINEAIRAIPALSEFNTTERGGSGPIDFGNGTIISFEIKHVTDSNFNRALSVISRLRENKIEIYLNDQHYLWRDFISKNNAPSNELKGKFIYPLAVAFAICQVQFDNKDKPLYSDMLPNEIKKMKFDEFFNKILKKYGVKK